MHLSRVDKVIVCSVAAAGIGVMTSAALAHELGIRKKNDEQNQIARLLVTEFELPSMPRSKEQFMHMWASCYETIKAPLSAFFEITGQALVAPIAMTAIDAVYAKVIEPAGDSKNTWSGAAA